MAGFSGEIRKINKQKTQNEGTEIMEKLSTSELNKRRGKYYGARDFFFKLTKACGSAIVLFQIDDGYEAFFNHAEIVSELTGLPVVPDYGFVRCLVGACVKPIIEAINKDGRTAAVIEPNERGRDAIKYYMPAPVMTENLIAV